MNAFEKIVAFIVLVAGLTFIPITSIAMRNENITYSAIESEVVDFVDTVRATGCITKENYENMTLGIAKWQPFMDIVIVHEGYAETPNGRTYMSFGKNDILTAIYDNEKDYKLRNHDRISVMVKNTRPTFASKLYNLSLNKPNENDVSIYIIYSGTVGNYIEEITE